MAKLWLIGDWKTGAVNETQILPVIKRTDTFRRDIHAEEEASLSVSKRDLPEPAEWKTYLKAGQRMVALVDDQTGVVHFAGPIIRTTGKVKDTIQIKIGGLKEYLARRIVSTVLTGTVADPTAGVEFKSTTYSQAIQKTVQHCFTGTGNPAPPTMGVFTSQPDGEAGTKFLNSDFIHYNEAIEELQDLSPAGNEYQFGWQWMDSSRNAIQFMVNVAPDSTPQINAETNLNLQLDNPNVKLLSFSETDDLNGSANRMIAQSKAGDEETTSGSDWQAFTVNPDDVLYDETFNPGVELTSAQMTAQITSRLNFIKNLQGTAQIEVVGGMTEWLANLGKQITITGGTHVDSSGYSITVRIAEVEVSVSDEKVRITIMPLAARYPKLPKPSNLFGGGKGFGNTGGNSGPIVPRIPSNQPLPSGGGGTPPTPTLPDFDIGNQFAATEPYLIKDGMDVLSGVNNATFFQKRETIYCCSNAMFEIYGSSSVFSSLGQMNDTLNSDIATALTPINFSNFQFTDSTTPIAQTDMGINLNIVNILGGVENFIPNFETYLPTTYLSAYVRVFFWTTETDIFVWLVGTKMAQIPIANVPLSTFGSVVLKNSLTGSETSWVEVDRNMTYDGSLIYPHKQQSIIVEGNEALFSGYVYLDSPASTQYDAIVSLGIESSTIGESWKIGQMAYAILGYNNNTQTFKSYGSPAWRTEILGKTLHTFPEAGNITHYKPMLWVKTAGSPEDARIGLISPPITVDKVSASWQDRPDEAALQLSVAYFNLTQASVELASTKVAGYEGQGSFSMNFSINKGMFTYTMIAPNIPNFKTQVLRTKNGSNQWISSNTEIDILGFGSESFEREYSSPSEWNTMYINHMTYPETGQMFTYGNYWAIGGLIFWEKGHFNN